MLQNNPNILDTKNPNKDSARSWFIRSVVDFHAYAPFIRAANSSAGYICPRHATENCSCIKRAHNISSANTFAAQQRYYAQAAGLYATELSRTANLMPIERNEK